MRVQFPLAALAALGTALWLAWSPVVASAVRPAATTDAPRLVLPAQVHEVTDLARDAAGHLVVAGTTYDPDFPTTPDAADRTCGRDGDAFVIVVAGDGGLRYSTCVGEQDSTESLPRVAVTTDGSVWVGAATCTRVDAPGTSTCPWNEPRARLWHITPGVPGARRGPVLIGGPNARVALADLAAAPDGSVWVLGTAYPSAVQTVNAWQPVSAGPSDLIIGHYAEGRTEPLLLTLLGGSQGEGAGRLAVAPDGDIVVSGHTSSTDFPVVRPTRGTRGGARYTLEVVLTRLDLTGRWLEYSTYLGAFSCGNEPALVAVDAVGRALLAGRASCSEFPVLDPSVPRNPLRDVYLLDVDDNGRLVSSVLIDTGLDGILARDLYARPVLVAARPDESVVVAGTYFSDDLLRGGVFIAVTDRFGTRLRQPELVLAWGAGFGGLEAVAADAARVWLAWFEKQPPDDGAALHFLTSHRLGDFERETRSLGPGLRSPHVGPGR